MFFRTTPLTNTEVLNEELKRLHKELNRYSWNNGEKCDPGYNRLLDLISNLHQEIKNENNSVAIV